MHVIEAFHAVPATKQEQLMAKDCGAVVSPWNRRIPGAIGSCPSHSICGGHPLRGDISVGPARAVACVVRSQHRVTYPR